MKEITTKVLGVIAIVLMGFTAAFDILGGIGTVCIAFFTENYPTLWAIIDYKWIYQIFVFVTLALGFAGVWVTLALIRGGKRAYRNALLLLAAGVVFGAIRVFTSLSLRGSAAPTNINWYFHILTLLVFLLFKLPGLSDHEPFSKHGDDSTKGLSAGLTALVVGVFLATSTIWLAPSHTFQGVNWADLLRTQMSIIGVSFILGGLFVLGLTAYRALSGGVTLQDLIHALSSAETRR